MSVASAYAERGLVVEHLTVAFGSHRALDDVSLSFSSSRVHALLGPNGSGKSTLIKFFSGVVSPRQGATVEVNGRRVRGELTPPRARDLGLRFVHQDMGLVPDLSVLDNLYLSNTYPAWAGQIRWRSARREAAEALASVGLPVDPKTVLRTLGHGERVLVAMARSLMRLPRSGGYLFLDEPTAALEERPSEQLLSSIRDLTHSGAIGVIFVTHRMREVLKFADTATVLRDGRVQYETNRVNPQIESDLLGALGAPKEQGTARGGYPGSPTEMVPAASLPAEDGVQPALMVSGLTGRLIKDVDLTVRPGEIVGVTGLQGSGKEELFDLLTGRGRPLRGTISVLGSTRPPGGQTSALPGGVGIIPGDRLVEGGIPDMTTAENLFLPHFATFQHNGRYRARQMYSRSAEELVRHGVEPPSPRRLFGTLSGGNQQKTILARWMVADPRLLLLQEPTAGVDVASRQRIYAELRHTVEGGVAAVVVSSDVAELAELCDRVVVLVDGRIEADLRGSYLTHENLTRASFESEE